MLQDRSNSNPVPNRRSSCQARRKIRILIDPPKLVELFPFTHTYISVLMIIMVDALVSIAQPPPDRPRWTKAVLILRLDFAGLCLKTGLGALGSL